MNNPLVSVVIPSYGGGEYLKRAIDSVLNQTYSAVEAIVVDDNGVGTPNQIATSKIMEAYRENEKVKYVCHEKNINGSAARNTGVRNSKGEYIALLDDDNEFLPNKIERQVQNLLLHPDCALTYCSNGRYHKDKLVETIHAGESKRWLYDVLIHNRPIGSTSLLIRRSAWEELGGFDESFRRHQDWEFTARVAALYKIFPDDFIGFKYHICQRNSPKNIKTSMDYRIHFLEKMKLYVDTLPYSQRRKVVVYNRVDVALNYLKAKDYKGFIKEYLKIKPGIFGIMFLANRFAEILKRGKLRLVK